MKTISIIFLFSLPSLLWGQIVNHFENTDSKWHVAKTYPAATQENPTFVATTTTVFGFQGDTTINSKQWLKLYSTNDSLFQSNLNYRGLIRSEDHHVFYLDTLNQLDTLYDFSLTVGDSTIFNFAGMPPVWLQVTDVDSVQMNGEFYKRLQFAEPELSAFDVLNEVWIVGIGSIHGPLFSHFPKKFSEEIPDSILLICSFSDDQLIWQNPYFANCYVNITLGVDPFNVLDFKLYPNPFSDEIYFENEGSNNYQLTILNSLGQVVREFEIAATTQVLNVSKLNPGIYFLRINNREQSKTIKIVKEQ